MSMIRGLMAGLLVLAGSMSTAMGGEALDAIRQRGHLTCGVSTGGAGFSVADEKGAWAGLDVDTCRAVAAAIFGDATKVEFRPHSDLERFTKLNEREVDILAHYVPVTMSREVNLGQSFPGVNYYAGQSFMVRKSAKIESIRTPRELSVCAWEGTVYLDRATAYFADNGLAHKILPLPTEEDMLKAYQDGNCEVLTTDAYFLYQERLKLAAPEEHVLLPESITREPLGPVVRRADGDLFLLVRWVLAALVNAEELGLTAANVEQALATSENEDVLYFMGQGGRPGAMLRLDTMWAMNVIAQVGNYGEIFDRNFGQGSPFKGERQLNALWSKGGLMHGLPIR